MTSIKILWSYRGIKWLNDVTQGIWTKQQDSLFLALKRTLWSLSCPECLTYLKVITRLYILCTHRSLKCVCTTMALCRESCLTNRQAWLRIICDFSNLRFEKKWGDDDRDWRSCHSCRRHPGLEGDAEGCEHTYGRERQWPLWQMPRNSDVIHNVYG